jgi:gamma-tubulin complex component 3
MVSHDDEEVSGQQLWEKKFKFRKDMLPSFVSEEFGRKVGARRVAVLTINMVWYYQIFSTGKSLNFIRYSCHDSEWVATRSKLNKASTLYCYAFVHIFISSFLSHISPQI